MYVEMKVAGLALDSETKGPVVVLKDGEGLYTLPIWIGLLEAAAIAYALEGVEPARPMTHDLLRMVIEETGARVPRVDIVSLEDDVFHARIHLELAGGATRLLDGRPSDALALALRVGAPVFADEGVLRRASAVAVKEANPLQGEREWNEYLENLDPEAFGKYKM